MIETISLTASLLALFISGLTAWLTLLKRGVVKMTRPTVIFLGPDRPKNPNKRPQPKVYFRTLLFSTSKRGSVIENIFVTLEKAGTTENFSIWVHETGKMLRGAGLFVPETGIEATHQFIRHETDSDFYFSEGTYRLNVFGHMLNNAEPHLLFSEDLNITSEVAKEMVDPLTGVYFDWEPHSRVYLEHLERFLPPVSQPKY